MVPRKTTHAIVHLKADRIAGNCSNEIDRHATYANNEKRRSKTSLVSLSHGFVASDAAIPTRIVAKIASPITQSSGPLRLSNRTTDNVPENKAAVIYLFPPDPRAPKIRMSSADVEIARAIAVPSKRVLFTNRNPRFLSMNFRESVRTGPIVYICGGS